ncbi:MAG: type IV pilus assembly protein PilM [Candidatus Azambacteria bacterium]|nr:type IV pilus assembly protein PilM [Candidatus Azambacteria bacterium]
MGLPFNIFGIASKPKSYLGIDIGTLSIKIVEISNEEGRPKLENYAILTDYGLPLKHLQDSSGKALKTFGGGAVVALRRLMKEGGINAKEVNMSVPIFSSFLTVMELPQMSELEVASAVPFEAKKYVPIPLDSVALDWSVIGSGDSGKILVLLIAIPRDIIDEYAIIAKEADLKLLTIELETISAARALIGNDPVPAVLIDLGSRDTTISVVDGGYSRISHSIEMSGEDLTRALANSLNIDWRRAEELKKQNGLKIMNNNDQIAGVLSPLLDVIVNTTRDITDMYFSKTKKKIEKLIVYGGASKMPGFVEYLNDRLKMDAVVGNPFSRVAYPDKLKPMINEIGHEFTVAVGLALKSTQQ